MKILKPSAILILATVGLFSSCVKERIIEKTIQPERIADKKIENSISPSQSSETIVLKKDQLGKAFLLSPTMFTTGQTPMPTFIKPMIVGFERYGNKVALYNYTDEQMYDVLPADKLLQTFKVLKESDTELVISFKEGFKSVNLVEALSIVMKESMEEMMKKVSSGQESSLEIKDSFIKNIKMQNNTIYVSQVIRTVDREIETKTNPMSPTTNPEKVQKFTTTESTNDYLFELKPMLKTRHLNRKHMIKHKKLVFS